jgi:hypothetical protein
MEVLDNTALPEPTSLSEEDKMKNMPGKIVLPDECGDALWDEVLAQNSNPTTDIKNPGNTVPYSSDAVHESEQIKPNS